ncbi:MAG: hypothetical protein LBF55_06405 [Prevotellaceae bacterium]|jgi:nitrite reductase/ring-hydroxylating ferredoxin subunit|nr:hypothetical protein [Prevotellaceae bacterium]
MLLRFSIRKRLPLCAAVALCAVACAEEYSCPVPSVERFELTVHMPSHEIMTAKVSAGYGYNRHGVIVYRYHNASNEVFAFDATCPNSEECLASGVVEPRDGHGICKKCSSRYSLIDGTHADKKIKLRAYYVQPLPNATDWFRVYN